MERNQEEVGRGGVRALILEVRESSAYADSPESYEFPQRYLKQFEGVDATNPLLALIYEPRREGGRNSFVAWAWIREAPARVPNGRYRVRYDGGMRSFDRPVPFRLQGIPVEHRLREIPSSLIGSQLQGRAVRALPLENASEILTLGMSDHAHSIHLVEPAIGNIQGRVRQLVERIARSARFRDQALRHFGFRCAVSGLRTSEVPASRIGGLLEAAHIHPVAKDGSDDLANALVLTPTVHRLFDAGYFTLERERTRVVIRRSKHLTRELHECPERGTVIRIEDGMPLMAPGHVIDGLSDKSIRFHRKHVFERLAS